MFNIPAWACKRTGCKNIGIAAQCKILQRKGIVFEPGQSRSRDFPLISKAGSQVIINNYQADRRVGKWIAKIIGYTVAQKYFLWTKNWQKKIERGDFILLSKKGNKFHQIGIVWLIIDTLKFFQTMLLYRLGKFYLKHFMPLKRRSYMGL